MSQAKWVQGHTTKSENPPHSPALSHWERVRVRVIFKGDFYEHRQSTLSNDATIKTADNLTTIAQALVGRQLSRLSLPEIEGVLHGWLKWFRPAISLASF
ncbi:MAG: hypothetical protein U0401_01150 [Anaerolineae bacterium]